MSNLKVVRPPAYDFRQAQRWAAVIDMSKSVRPTRRCALQRADDHAAAGARPPRLGLMPTATGFCAGQHKTKLGAGNGQRGRIRVVS